MSAVPFGELYTSKPEGETFRELCCFSIKIRDKVFSEYKRGFLLEKVTDFLMIVGKICQMKKRGL